MIREKTWLPDLYEDHVVSDEAAAILDIESDWAIAENTDFIVVYNYMYLQWVATNASNAMKQGLAFKILCSCLEILWVDCDSNCKWW